MSEQDSSPPPHERTNPRIVLAFRVGLTLGRGRWPSKKATLEAYSQSRHLFDLSGHYHEAHITVEPMLASLTFDLFRERYADEAWRVSAFSEDDVDHIGGKWFLTARHKSYREMRGMVASKVGQLREAGLTVLRAKIEDTLLDTKYGDKL